MEEKSSNIISNVAWKFAERILAQLVSLVVSVILARILLPEDYGAISMVMVFITIANVFVTDGIPTALIQKKEADELDFSSVFHFNLGVSIIIYVILYCAAPAIAQFYKTPILSPVIRVLGIRLIVASVNSVQHAYVSRNMIFKKYFWSTLFGTLFSGVVGIIMAYKGYGVWALVAQYMTNTTVDTIVLFITVHWRPTLQFQFCRIKGLLKFGWRILFEGVSNAISGQIRNLVIGRVYTSSDLAFYSKGQQFPSLIVTNVSASIGSVLFPAIANEQDDKVKVLAILRKAIRTSTYVIYPILFGLAAIAPAFVSCLLTDKWDRTIPYLQIYCFMYMSTVALIPRHQALNGCGRSDIFMREHILSRVISFILLIATYRISVMAIAISGIVSTIVLILIVAFTSKKYTGYSYRDQLFDILPTVIGCMVMAIPVYLINYLMIGNGIKLIIQILLGTAIYLSYSILFKLEEFTICKQYAGGIISKFKK